MARGKAHDEATRAAVVAALLAGQGVTEVATRHKLDPSVVSRWKASLPAEKLQEVASEKKSRFDDLLADYLAANLLSLTAMAKVASEPDYLRKQSADRLAVLHGVTADKAVRFFEAASGPDEAEAEEG